MTLTIYVDYINEGEGGKSVPLPRPIAPTAQAAGNVVPLRCRSAGWEA